MLEMGSVALELGTLIFQLFVFLPSLAFLVFLLYFAYRVLQFMKHKARLDEERNQKLGELIRILEKSPKE